MGGDRIEQSKARAGKVGSALLGSLRDALAAAGRDDGTAPAGKGTPEPAFDTMKDVTNALAPPEPAQASNAAMPPTLPAASPPTHTSAPVTRARKSADDAAREARGGTPTAPAFDETALLDGDPATPSAASIQVAPAAATERANQQAPRQAAAADPAGAGEPTQFVRGKQKVGRQTFAQDPVVGWLVIVGGPGLGAFRPVFEGNNTIGRGPANRIPIDFGDDSISTDEQAYLRYDPTDRSFLLVPNMSKTNVITHNESRPAQPVPLAAMDLITMGRTQLVFVPFCGADFDWAELSELGG
ncbi:MAG: FHA domain-containing protein [Pseudomonadota bacterium]